MKNVLQSTRPQLEHRLDRFEPPLHRAHGFQVFIDLLAVGSADSPPQRLGVRQHEIQDARVVALQGLLNEFGSWVESRDDREGGTGAEQPVKYQLRNGLFGDRRVRIAPGHMRAEDARKGLQVKGRGRWWRVSPG